MRYFLRNFLFFSIVLFFTNHTWAFLTVAESGELLPIGQYRLTTESQFSSLGSGLTLNLHFDMAVDESSQIRFSTGFGGVDFFGAFAYKWIPYPDSDKQPAIGFKVDATIKRDGNQSTIITRFIPLVSKKIKIDLIEATPYAALPIGVAAANSSTTQPTNFVIGSEVIHHSLQKVNFGTELGINLKDSNSYFTLFAVFYYDRHEGNKN